MSTFQMSLLKTNLRLGLKFRPTTEPMKISPIRRQLGRESPNIFQCNHPSLHPYNYNESKTRWVDTYDKVESDQDGLDLVKFSEISYRILDQTINVDVGAGRYTT